MGKRPRADLDRPPHETSGRLILIDTIDRIGNAFMNQEEYEK